METLPVDSSSGKKTIYDIILKENVPLTTDTTENCASIFLSLIFVVLR
jgi:hypothetical protein